jgi:hypothetical protein
MAEELGGEKQVLLKGFEKCALSTTSEHSALTHEDITLFEDPLCIK